MNSLNVPDNRPASRIAPLAVNLSIPRLSVKDAINKMELNREIRESNSNQGMRI